MTMVEGCSEQSSSHLADDAVVSGNVSFKTYATSSGNNCQLLLLSFEVSYPLDPTTTAGEVKETAQREAQGILNVLHQRIRPSS